MSWTDVVAEAYRVSSKNILSDKESLVFYTFAFGIKYPERREEALRDLNEALSS